MTLVGKRTVLGKTAGAVVVALLLLSVMTFAQTSAAARYDNQIQASVMQKLAAKSDFKAVK